MDTYVAEEYLKTFEPFYQNMPVSPYEDIKMIFEKETGKKISDVFSEFDQKPLASASLAQVHKAKLKSTGETVAVKVQHARLQEEVMGDLRILDLAADLGGKYFAQFDYKWYTDDFREMIKQEMDFRIEANNCKKCRDIFQDSKNIVVPKVYDDYSTPRTLVMSFEEGVNVGKI